MSERGKRAMANKGHAPVFGRPKGWANMKPEQRREWALGLLRAATEKPQKR